MDTIIKLLEEYATREGRIGPARRARGILRLRRRCDKLAAQMLDTALREGRMDAVELLVAHGASADTVDTRGQTPLDHAIARKGAEIVRLLLAHGEHFELVFSSGIW